MDFLHNFIEMYYYSCKMISNRVFMRFNTSLYMIILHGTGSVFVSRFHNHVHI